MAFLNQLTPVRANMIRGIPDNNLGEATGGIYPSIEIIPSPETSFDSFVTSTRSTTGDRRNAFGDIESVAIDGERLDYDSETGEFKGYLHEENSTNLLTYSDDFSHADWPKQQASVTANAAVAPDGTTTADKLYEDSTASDDHRIRRDFTVTQDSIYTFSIFLKKAERDKVRLYAYNNSGAANIDSADFDLTNGTISGETANADSAFTIEAYPDDWYRCTVTYSNNADTITALSIYLVDGNGDAIYNGDGSSGVYLWRGQNENYAKATSPIATTSAAVTRSKDILQVDNNALSYDWYNEREGTVFCEMQFLVRSLTEYVFTLCEDNDNYIALRGRSVNDGVAMRLRSGGVNEFDDVISVDQSQMNKFCFTYKDGEQKFYINGALVASNSFSGAFPSGAFFEFGELNGASELAGWMKHLAYFPKAISEAAALTITE